MSGNNTKTRAPVIWFTGISGSGKTTLASRLFADLKKKNSKCDFLDGDRVRAFFCGDLGYTKKERVMNVKRIAFASHLLSENGILTIVANIAPYYEVRDFIRANIKNYVQIYCATSLVIVSRRDVKGLYDNRFSGKEDNVIGVDDIYDIPRSPDIVVHTHAESEDESYGKIYTLLINKGIINE